MQTISKNTDEYLINSYLSGDNEAFKELLFKHKDMLYRYIFSLTKNKELTEDFFQDTFIKAVILLKNGEYQDRGRFYMWLCRLAHNIVMDYYRRSKNVILSQNNSEVDLFKDISILQGNIQDDIIDRELKSEVKSLVELLPDTQKEVIKLRFYKNLSFKEIADMLDININTALGRLRYGVKNLRKLAYEYDVLSI